jgi:hypothetical protein
MKCTACGSAALIEGTIKYEAPPLFFPTGTPVLKSAFGVGGRKVRAYGCIRCQNLQLAVEFSESDLERYQQFEGEQPGVLERINSGPKKLEGDVLSDDTLDLRPNKRR